MEIPRIFRCSQCGEVGHNRRNMNCPVNVRNREEAAARLTETAIGTTNYNTAKSLLVNISRILRLTHANACLNIDRFPLIEEYGATNTHLYTDLVYVISSVLTIICRVSDLLTDAFEYIDVFPLIEVLKTQIDILNAVIQEQHIHMTEQIEGVMFRTSLYKICIQETGFIVSTTIVPALFYRNLSNNISTYIGDYNAGITLRSISLSYENVELILMPHDTLLPSPVHSQYNIANIHNRRLCILDLKTLTVVNEQSSDSTEEATCPICFDTAIKCKLLQTNCDHWFCVDCLINYTDSIKYKTCKPNCPYCRTVIVGLKSNDEDICRKFSHHIARM